MSVKVSRANLICMFTFREIQTIEPTAFEMYDYVYCMHSIMPGTLCFYCIYIVLDIVRFNYD